MRVIAFNKPYGVLCQFTDAEGRPTLADYLQLPDVYPAGRLDQDSEGLLLLTDDGALQAAIADPRHKTWKRYLAQVERAPDKTALENLKSGVELQDGRSLPAKAGLIVEPDWLWPRDPPIRFRKNIMTAWLELEIQEGRNRQVRRMTAAVGHPTLRLIRVAVGTVQLSGLKPGEWRELAGPEIESLRPAAASRLSRSRPNLHKGSGRDKS